MLRPLLTAVAVQDSFFNLTRLHLLTHIRIHLITVQSEMEVEMSVMILDSGNSIIKAKIARRQNGEVVFPHAMNFSFR